MLRQTRFIKPSFCVPFFPHINYPYIGLYPTVVQNYPKSTCSSNHLFSPKTECFKPRGESSLHTTAAALGFSSGIAVEIGAERYPRHAPDRPGTRNAHEHVSGRKVTWLCDICVLFGGRLIPWRRHLIRCGELFTRAAAGL